MPNKDWNKWYACDILTEEVCLDRYHQDDTGIPTNGSTRNTQKIEGGNHLSRIGI